ncbi:MAG: MBL fold metallo-hydrolase [Candidatus Peregrinibacteria bacterium]
MAQIVSLGGPHLRCTFGTLTFQVFAPSGPKAGLENTYTLLAHPEEEPVKGTISWPGEYDFSLVSVRGLGHEDGRQVSYVVVCEGIRYAFLSTPLHTLSDFELGLIGDIDILAIPADDLKTVQTLVDAIDPRVLIPLHTGDDKVFQDLLKAFGAVGKEAVDEYKVKSSLPAEGREVVILREVK